MNDLMLHERTFADPAYLSLEIGVERETWLRLFSVCDRNWGNVGCVDLRDLAVRLWPEAARAVLDGDDAAREILRAAVRGIEHAAEVGLLIVEDTRDGIAVGYRSWEEYTGKWRRSRGAPTEPMGPRLAACRDWSRLGPRSRESAVEWARRLGVLTSELDAPQVQSFGTTRTAGVESSELSAPNREPGAGSHVPRAGSREPCGVADADEPLALDERTEDVNPELPPRAATAYTDAGLAPERAASLADAGLTKDADADPRVYPLAIVLEALERSRDESDRYHGRPRALAERKLRCGDPAERPQIGRARKLLGVGKAPARQAGPARASPAPTEAATRAYRCSRDGCRERQNGGLIRTVPVGEPPGQCTCGAEMIEMGAEAVIT